MSIISDTGDLCSVRVPLDCDLLCSIRLLGFVSLGSAGGSLGFSTELWTWFCDLSSGTENVVSAVMLLRFVGLEP